MIRIKTYSLTLLYCVIGYSLEIPALQSGLLFLVAAAAGSIYSQLWNVKNDEA
jgi:hypothetical protein